MAPKDPKEAAKAKEAMKIRNAKADLRKNIKSHLSQLTEHNITSQSHTAQTLILSLPQYQKAQRLGIYLSMPTKEAQTSTLVTHALENGRKVFVPYIHHPPNSPRKVIDMLHLRSLDEFNGLERDSWGIPTLPKDGLEARENAMGGMGLGDGEMLEVTEDGEGRTGEEGTLDLVVVPGVAFDEGMNRLGHGGGFYDGFLERFCSDGTQKPYLGMYSFVFFSFIVLADPN
jgi:5-formyltetrahydrofolate cyclo-ligase